MELSAQERVPTIHANGAVHAYSPAACAARFQTSRSPVQGPGPGLETPVLRGLCGLSKVALSHTRLFFLKYLGASSHGPSACVPWRITPGTFLNGSCSVRVDVL